MIKKTKDKTDKIKDLVGFYTSTPYKYVNSDLIYQVLMSELMLMSAEEVAKLRLNGVITGEIYEDYLKHTCYTT